ncbi:MAG: hypothetical protein CVU97_03315 [Firmicutes bacterium HGW-Firmicutes-21]|nr:MAG: hypothetical protein CVU97_03315 [Firmicutes bacterium HGW-Firmicutes-21]
MKRLFREEQGASAIIIAFAMTLILTVSALAIDIGAAYVEVSNAQNAADAIAMSVGMYLPVKQDDEQKKTLIINKAIEYSIKNKVDGFKASDVTFGDLKNGKYTSVTLSVSKISITRLAGIVGVDSINIVKTATVAAVPTGEINGAVPMGINEAAYNHVMETGENEHIRLKVGGGSGDTGFYGFLVLDDSNGNANVLEQWFKFGYPGANSVGEILPVATGNKTSVAKNGSTYRLSQCTHYAGQGGCTPEHYEEECPKIIRVLIYRMVDSRTVEVIGFAAFLLEYTSADDEIQGTFLGVNTGYTDKISDKDFGTYTYRLTG